MGSLAFLIEPRTISMRYDAETDRLLDMLSAQQGVIQGTIVRLAVRSLPNELPDAAVKYMRENLERLPGRRTTWVEDANDRLQLDELRQTYGLSRRALLRYAVRQYARRWGIAVDDAAFNKLQGAKVVA